jgi:hypothetical protein
LISKRNFIKTFIITNTNPILLLLFTTLGPISFVNDAKDALFGTTTKNVSFRKEKEKEKARVRLFFSVLGSGWWY